MRALVLGSAAGGGVPQWNCRCPVCLLAWAGTGQVKQRTQTSVAISADGRSWIVLDAAPDLRQQIIATPALHPQDGSRHSPIAAVFLTSGDVDHLAGLFCLRERHAFALYGTAATLDQVSGAIFGVLDPQHVSRRTLSLDDAVEPVSGLRVTAFAVPGKVPLYLEVGEVAVGRESESVVGLDVSDGARRICYIPGCARITPALKRHLDGADLLLFDGTTFTDDEMPALGLSEKTASRMGHLAMSADDGSLAGLADVRIGEKVYIHLNNTNPVLIEGSPEQKIVAAAGWGIAYDGMEIAL